MKITIANTRKPGCPLPGTRATCVPGLSNRQDSGDCENIRAVTSENVPFGRVSPAKIQISLCIRAV